MDEIGATRKFGRRVLFDKTVIDAAGKVVTPGFIDSHSHADSALKEFPELIEKAKAEHKAKIGDGYVCGIPADVQPLIMPKK